MRGETFKKQSILLKTFNTQEELSKTAKTNTRYDNQLLRYRIGPIESRLALISGNNYNNKPYLYVSKSIFYALVMKTHWHIAWHLTVGCHFVYVNNIFSYFVLSLHFYFDSTIEKFLSLTHSTLCAFLL